MSAAAPQDFSTRAEFGTALQWAFRTAHERQARRLWLVDPDFAAWPLDQPDVLAALQAWLRLPQRRLVLLAAHYADMGRCHPRFVQWRRHWAHAVDAFAPAPESTQGRLPRRLVDDGPVCLQLFYSVQLRGRAELDAPQARRWRDEIDAILQQSETAFPVQTLGL